MVEYAIDCAVEAGCFDEIIVSSESKETELIIEKYNTYNVKVDLRNPKLSGPNATVADVCVSILNKWNPEKMPESFCVLLPTSPLRTSQNILDAVKIFEKEKANCVMSVTEYKYHPNHALGYAKWQDYTLHLERYLDKNYELYHHDGNVIVCNTNAFLIKKDFYDIYLTFPYFTPEENAIDVNTNFDLKVARLLMGDKSE